MNNDKINVVDQVFMSELMSVQATTLALQNKVDAVRNEDIIRNTAIGTAYSKWINSPALSSQYKEMISSMSKDDHDEYHVAGANAAGTQKLTDSEVGSVQPTATISTVGSALNMVQQNQKFYEGNAKGPNDTNANG